jgi:cell division protein FtsW
MPIKTYKKLVPFALFGVFLSLAYLLISGDYTNGARSWIDLGFFSLQPSEFAKTVLVLFMAIYYGNMVDKKNVKYEFFVPLAIAIIIFFLVALQPDLGTAIIIAGIVFLTFLAIPFPSNQLAKTLKIIGGTVAVLMMVFILSGSDFLTDMQKSRLTFKAPCTRYTEETGYQVCNGFIAINNGGLLGKGLGNSTQKYLYLPEAHTDFIFPIMVEEMGLIFGIIFIFGYMYILWRIVKIAKRSYNLRNSIICYGIAIYLFLHLMVNFLGILALIPLTGVPVPFLSYGGSFTVNVILSMFIVQRVSVENNITKLKREMSRI